MSEVRSTQPEPEFAAFIGIDWADQKHTWCLQTAGSENWVKRHTDRLALTRHSSLRPLARSGDKLPVWQIASFLRLE